MLAKKEAIRRHRLMWNWIADETEKRGRCVTKEEAFKHFCWRMASMDCWCCEYDSCHISDCCGVNCIIVWPGTSCAIGPYDGDGLYTRWCNTREPSESAALARQIAELPEREESHK